MANSPHSHKLSHLTPPDEQALPEDIVALYEQLRHKPGFVPNVYRALGARPEQLRGFVALYQAIMEQDSGLSKAEREMIAVAVSSMNECAYCMISHGAALRIRARDTALADLVAANYRAADLPPRQRAMLDYAVKITLASHLCDQNDLDTLYAHGFSESDVIDIVQTAAFFNYSNRVASALGLQPNREYFALGRG
jgi:uncharacterized peroxidase-related enzyme